MRFAITGGDRCIGIFEALVDAGWEPLRLFTVPQDTRQGFDRSAIDCARRGGADVQISRLDDSDPAALGKNDCDIVVPTAYAVCRQSALVPWKAPGPASLQHPAVYRVEPLNDGLRV